MFLVYIAFLLITVILFPPRRGIGIPAIYCVTIGFVIFAALSTLGLFGLYPPSLSTHLLIIFAYICYLFSYAMVKRHTIDLTISTSMPNNKLTLLKILNIIVILIMIPWVIVVFQAGGQDSLVLQRDELYYQFLGNSRNSALFQAFAIPIICISVITSVDMLLIQKKNDVFLFILSFIGPVMHAYCFMARAIIMKSLCYAIIYVFFIYPKFNKRCIEDNPLQLIKARRRKKLVFVAIALLIAGIYITTLSRTSVYEDEYEYPLLRTFSIYFIGPFSLFDHMLSKPETSKMFTFSLSYGSELFGGVYNTICNALTMVGFDYFGSDNRLTQITALNYQVGDGISMNAAVTAMMPFIRDFSIFGIPIGFSMWGIIISKLESKLSETDMRSRMLFSYLLYVTFKFSQSYEGVNPGTFITLVLIWFFTSDQKNCNSNQEK